MEIVCEKLQGVEQMLAPKDLKIGGLLRWSAYVVMHEVADGLLVWNELTRQLALLPGVNADDARRNPAALTDAHELYRRSFLVPHDMDEHHRLDQCLLLMSRLHKPANSIGYVVYTTMGCNARCHYCYERDYPRSTMTEATAVAVAEFIRRSSAGKKVNIKWFGGEPLLNIRAIDTIVGRLSSAGVEFTTTIISNSLLFSESLAQRAASQWHLQSAQVTLDGTETAYNTIKNYVNAVGSPYRRVLENIDHLLAAGIKVSIRLNLSLENYTDLLALADELHHRFGSRSGLGVYAYPLYEYNTTLSAADCERLLAAYRHLTATLAQYGMWRPALPKAIPHAHCMADTPGSYAIYPSGRLGKCEHRHDDDAIGDVWQGVTDTAAEAQFGRRRPATDRCRSCWFAPSCRLLDLDYCYEQCNDIYLTIQRNQRQWAMESMYKKKQTKQ